MESLQVVRNHQKAASRCQVNSAARRRLGSWSACARTCASRILFGCLLVLLLPSRANGQNMKAQCQHLARRSIASARTDFDEGDHRRRHYRTAHPLLATGQSFQEGLGAAADPKPSTMQQRIEPFVPHDQSEEAGGFLLSWEPPECSRVTGLRLHAVPQVQGHGFCSNQRAA